MIRMTLAEVTRAVGGTLHLSATDHEESPVDGVVDTDSREMGPGSVFVAKPGDVTDGHLFVGAAAEAGAALAIVERVVDAPISQIVVAPSYCLNLTSPKPFSNPTIRPGKRAKTITCGI